MLAQNIKCYNDYVPIEGWVNVVGQNSALRYWVTLQFDLTIAATYLPIRMLAGS